MQLELNNISYDYLMSRGRMYRALEQVSVTIKPGQSYAIIGPSGCGKTTLLELAAGMRRPSEGEVLLNGAPLTKPQPCIGYIMQSYGLMPWKTVLGNVSFGLALRKVAKDQRMSRTQQMIDRVGLTGFEGSYPHELSGGMRQRVALARSLCLELELLLMDEPLSALDPSLREDMQNLLISLHKQFGYAQVIVSHDLDEALLFGQQIIVLTSSPGRIAKVYDNPHAGELYDPSNQGIGDLKRQLASDLARKEG